MNITKENKAISAVLEYNFGDGFEHVKRLNLNGKIINNVGYTYSDIEQTIMKYVKIENNEQ